MAPLLRHSGPAIALGAALIIVTVSIGDAIGPLCVAGVVLLVLGMVGQVLRARRQRPTQQRRRRIGPVRPPRVRDTRTSGAPRQLAGL